MASAYQGAIEAVVAMVICALGGWWIDGRLGSAPIGLFLGMALGFTAFLVRLLRIKTPTLGRPSLPPEPVSERDEAGDERREVGWTEVLHPARDDEDEGGRPK